MKVTSHLVKNTTIRNHKIRDVDSILSKITGKTRVGKANSQPSTASSSCTLQSPTNHKTITEPILASRIRLQGPAKHKTITGPERHSVKTITFPLEQSEKNTKRELTHDEIMSALAETLKKREIQISKSMDKRFESSEKIITETLSVYLEKEENIVNKIAYEYRNRMDEHMDEKLALLRKLQFRFEKYQLTASTLLEALDNNHSQSLRTKKDFMKDMEQIHFNHQSEIAQLFEEIDTSTEHFNKIISIAVKETQKKSSFASQLKSLFRS